MTSVEGGTGARVAIVTGGGTGVGAATAITLAGRGYRQRILDRQPQRQRQFVLLCGLQGSAEYAHAVARAHARAGDPRQRGAAGVHRDPMAQERIGRGNLSARAWRLVECRRAWKS